MNMPKVVAALQAMALRSAVPGLRQTIYKGLPAVIQPAARAGGRSYLRVFTYPGAQAVAAGTIASVRRQNGEVIEALVMDVIVPSVRARIAANVPQFTAFVGRLLYEYVVQGSEGEPPRLDIP